MRSDPFRVWLDHWKLVADGPGFTTRWGNHLMPVFYNGTPAMLKIATGEEEIRGAALMSWYGGRGAVRVFAHEGAALLIERAANQISLGAIARDGQDDQATAILCQCAAELHAPRNQPPPPDLIPLSVWFRALDLAAARHAGTFAKSLTAARTLLADPRDIVVLHGDFHHDNVLDGGSRGWLAIDPKGLSGERGFEYANLFRNPDADMALAPGRMRRQAAIMAELAALEPRRLFQWILAYAGLGTAWSLEAGDDPGPGLAIAEIAAAELRS
jgi:streptomycin 6-kinase